MQKLERNVFALSRKIIHTTVQKKWNYSLSDPKPNSSQFRLCLISLFLCGSGFNICFNFNSFSDSSSWFNSCSGWNAHSMRSHLRYQHFSFDSPIFCLPPGNFVPIFLSPFATCFPALGSWTSPVKYQKDGLSSSWFSATAFPCWCEELVSALRRQQRKVCGAFSKCLSGC